MEITADALAKKLQDACSSGYAACRAITRLIPVGGKFDRILPPTYAGGKYATEKRRLNGEDVDTVLLDSVQSQANRFEALLLEATERKEIEIPLVSVTFANGRRVTALDAPHRIADAIFRDCNLDEEAFRDSTIGRSVFSARADNAVELFRYAPTSLLLGMWDSTDLLKRPGAKIARALTSEIVGIASLPGQRTASRIDPLGIRKSQRTMYLTEDGRWTFDPEQAAKKKDKQGHEVPIIVGKEGKPSEVNHGNVLPNITYEEKNSRGEAEVKIHGGVTIREAIQTTVLSFAQLRQLRFPCGENRDQLRDRAARAVLAALGIYAVSLQWCDGYQLRSRCQLIPEAPSAWEFIRTTAADSETFEIPVEVARGALSACVNEAKARGLGWNTAELKLTPSAEFAQLVRENDDYSAQDAAE